MAPDNKDKTHTPLEVPPWWPGATGTMRVPADGSLKGAAKALDRQLRALDIAMSDLDGDGLVTAADVGNWDAGQTLAQTVKNAHEHISTVCCHFQEQLSSAAQFLLEAQQGHADAEHAATKAARMVSDASSPVPNSYPTRQSTPSMD